MLVPSLAIDFSKYTAESELPVVVRPHNYEPLLDLVLAPCRCCSYPVCHRIVIWLLDSRNPRHRSMCSVEFYSCWCLYFF